MQFTVHRHALDLQMQARMLGQLGIGPGFHVYGIAFTEDAPNFWGINFPPLAQSDGSWARTRPMYSGCGKNLIFALNEIEYRVFNANQRFCLGCETCGHNVACKPVPNQPNLAAAGSGSAEMGQPPVYSHPNESHDLHSKVRRDDEMLRFRTSLAAASACAAVASPRSIAGSSSLFPTLGAVNFFVSGRVAWRKDMADDKYEHGVPYVRG